MMLTALNPLSLKVWECFGAETVTQTNVAEAVQQVPNCQNEKRLVSLVR